MDFHCLTRKELQALCKLNKIPANLTNIAMADSLSALQHVEGIEEMLNQSQSGPDDKTIIGTPIAPRTSCRTSTRPRKVVIKDDPESSQPLTRTRRAATKQEVSEEKAAIQEKIEVPSKTPAAPSTRRRVPVVSAAKTTVTRTTRRSVRLLEETLEKLCLGEDAKAQFTKACDLEKVDMKDESTDINVELNYGFHGDEVKDTKVHEEEGLKEGSELKDMAESTDENIDVKSETLVERVIESDMFAKLPVIEAHQDLETNDSLSVETSDEPKETFQPVSPTEDVKDDTLIEKTPVEDSTTVTDKALDTKPIVSVINVDDVKSELVRSESATEEETDEESFEHTEIEFVEAEKKLDEIIADEEETDEESSEEESVDIDDDAELLHTELEFVEAEKKSDEIIFEEEGTDEEESSEEEETDEESSEEESVDIEDDAESEEESDLETSLAGNIVAESRLDEKSPLSLVSATKIGAKTPLLSPFAADQLSGQFPRPSLPKPSKSSTKSHSVIQMITDALDETDEKTDVKKNEDKFPAANSLERKSLRELHKLLKTKLQITNDKTERIALQTIPTNRLAVDELPKEN